MKFYIFKIHIRLFPDIFLIPKDIQQKIFDNINKYQEDLMQKVIEKREEIIEIEEKKNKRRKEEKEKKRIEKH